MFESVRSYLSTRYNACDFEFSLSLNNCVQVPCTPHYTFNKAERLGNFLLIPLDKVFKKYDDTYECPYTCEPILRVALIVAGVFAAIVGAVGAAIKEVGERANTNRTVRKAATITLREVINYYKQMPTMLTLATLSLQGVRVDRSFSHNILIAKKGARLEDVYRLNDYDGGITGLLFAFKWLSQSSEEEQAQQARLKIVQPIVAQWKEVWSKIKKKVEKNEEMSAEVTGVINMVSEDDATKKEASEYLNELQRIARVRAKFFSLCDHYNQIVRKMH